MNGISSPATAADGAAALSRRAAVLAVIDRRAWLLLAAICLVPVAAVVISARHGLELTPDSIGYVAAARSLAATGQLVYWDGLPFVHWPPGLPILLGIGLRLGIDPEAFGIAINLVALVALIVLTYALARLLPISRPAALLAAGLVAISQSTIRVYASLLSEPLFLLLSLATVLLLARMARDRVRPGGLIALALCVAAAGSIRYIGVALLPIVGLSLLIMEARRGLPRAFAIATGGTLLSAIGSVVVMAHNLIVSGSVTGTFHPSNATLADLLHICVVVFGQWVVPQLSDGTAAMILGIAVAAMVAVGALVLLRNSGTRPTAAPLAIFVAGYLGVLVVSELRVDGYIDHRYLAPLLAPSIIVSIGAASTAWRWAMARIAPGAPSTRLGLRAGTWIAGAGVAVLMLAFVVANAAFDARMSLRAARLGVGYNQLAIQRSELAKVVLALPSPSVVLSNDPVRLYWLSDELPQISNASISADGDPATAIRALIQAGTLTHYAAFTNSRTLQGVSAENLATWGVTLVSPVQYSDGTLYRMTLTAPGG